MQMKESNQLVAALYKARQEKLDDIEEVRGPLSEWETQNEVPVALGDARPFMQKPSDTLEPELETLTELVKEGLFSPVGIPDTQGRIVRVKFNSVSLELARRLTQL